MAQKKKATSRSASTEKEEAAKVTRITAKDTRAAADKKSTKSAKTEKTKAVVEKDTQKSDKKKVNPIKGLGGYFKGAWSELRQVRWPNRRTTWGLTLAVIAFTLFFTVLIVLLDFIFQWAFDQIIG